MPKPLIVLVLALATAIPSVAKAAPPDPVLGHGANEGWFEFDVRVHVQDGRARGTLRVDEFGTKPPVSNYDVSGRVVCGAVLGNGAVIAAIRLESPSTIRVVFLALRDLDGTGLGPDLAAPAFSVVPTDEPLAPLCQNSLWLLGITEPLDSGGVLIRDR